MNPWTLLVNLLGSTLSFFYDIVPEYGVAIIFLTLLVGVLLFPLTYKQTKSMKAMQDIQPEVKRLQKEFKGDREELNKQLMALYQERGVNPAAGCLPLLVQMPIWFALYRVLWQGSGIPEGSDLRSVIDAANAALYTTNADGSLSATLQPGVDIASDQFSHVIFLGMNMLVRPSAAVDLGNILGSLPYILLIAAIVVAGFYQQVQTTRRKPGATEELNAQAQTMQRAMRIMPVVFGFISWSFVSGLGLYFATSNIFRVGQQAIILRTAAAGGDGDDKGKGHAEADDPSDEPTSSGPSQHASKKRNRRRRK
ncbi:MAG TPA: YidC/Oxa1 family membrane protein insertase [Acidimicrobiia bacterium]|nr:YidC/Oxa1 family membrane protein insertase [Acidimicrobiia bacterium]